MLSSEIWACLFSIFTCLLNSGTRTLCTCTNCICHKLFFYPFLVPHLFFHRWFVLQFTAIILLRIFACISGSLIQAQAKNPYKFICCQNIYFALVSLFQFLHWVMTILRDFLVYKFLANIQIGDISNGFIAVPNFHFYHHFAFIFYVAIQYHFELTNEFVWKKTPKSSDAVDHSC